MNALPYQFSRRNLLRFAAALGVTAGLPALMSKSATARPTVLGELPKLDHYPDRVDLRVLANEVMIGDRPRDALTVNGIVPGPILRFQEGQTITLNVTNQLETDTSIHWHGLILPAQMDGVPGVSFHGIKPGQTFSYRFPLNQNGTYWYHSHSGLQEQQGHFGALIIDPAIPEPIAYDRDYVVMLSDWTDTNPRQILRNLKKVSTYYNQQRRTIGNFFDDLEWGQMRMDATDIADVTGATYTYLMNGLTPETNWTALFNPGEKVRLRFINASAMTFFDVQIPGLKLTVIQADGQNVQPVTVDEFRIGVAETYDVIVEPEADQTYTIFAETMDRSGYARGTLATQPGLVAALPVRRTRPLRTMADMGHGDHGSHGAGHQTSNQKQQPPIDHSGHDMSDMDHSGHEMPNHANDHSGMGNLEPHGPDDHGPGNAGVPMMVSNRLHEPGIGLENTPEHRVLVYTDLRSREPGYDQRSPERELELHLTGNMERYMWSFDGKKYSESPMLTFYHGERLRLTFVNDTMMEHPMHLHGMWMEVDNGTGAYKPRKHVLIVKPAEKCSVEITVDAPGNWAFHCHLLYHMEAGMMRTVAVVEPAAGGAA
ncbi:MAG: copper resistance system multicopper oxidase [Spirulina sp. SIO3F2]|nr:copper resistance system multicopper oxidase [Spirulina sp. SIO3F2]